MDEITKLFYQDLKKYPQDKITNLAKYMKLSSKNITIDDLCFELAKKLAYVNTDRLPDDQDPKCKRYNKKFTQKEIAKIRSEIYNKFIRFKNSVSSMTSKELHDLFIMYDKLCFNGEIYDYIKQKKFSLTFKTSGEDTFTTEGICTFQICEYIITIPIHYFDKVNGITNVAGHMCNDQLECLLRVMEHELVHLIIFIFCGDIFVADQHGPLFMNMVRNLFHHTDHRHYIF